MLHYAYSVSSPLYYNKPFVFNYNYTEQFNLHRFRLTISFIISLYFYMSEDDKRDNFIRGMSSRMANQQIGQLHQDISVYEAGLIPPIPEPPQTFVIECNKVQGVQDGDAERTNAWTNTFPPVKLKKGDVISVNSAFLSTRGAGDLLQFDDSNNKTRLLFEYYATNDNANLKRPDYNIKGNVAGVKGPYTYNADAFLNCYPANYRPMRLQRLAETFKTIEDYTTTTPPFKPDIPDFTKPTSDMPFYSPTIEKYWGYKNSKDFVLDAVEDKYVDGMFRPPKIVVREFMTHVKDTDDDPTSEPFFGLALDNLSVWYVSTPMSKLGPCSDNATMRIYFAYGTDTEFEEGDHDVQKASKNETLTLLRALRVGEVIQFKQPAWTFGEYAYPYIHYNSLNGEQVVMEGTHAFYCDGYDSLGDGIPNENIGASVDRFTQIGHESQVSKYYDMSVRECMGQFMRITKINIGNTDPGFKEGKPQPVMTTYAEYTDGEPFERLPWIEVSCDKGMSLAFNNPNWEHPEGIPTMTGPTRTPGKVNIDNISLPYHTQVKHLQLRCWTAGKTKNLTRTLKTDITPGRQATDLGVSALGLYPTNPMYNKGAELQEDFYVAFRPYYFSNEDTDNEEDNMKQSYTMNLVEDSIGLGETNKNTYSDKVGLTHSNPEIVAHNYNFSNLNKDLTVNPDKDGYDIQEDGNYQGARSPQNWNSSFGFGANGYTPPTQDVKRIGVFNQGQEWWMAGVGFVSNNLSREQGFYQPLDGAGADNRLSRNQSTLNSNGDIYLKNDKDKNMIFYFTEDITADGSAYDGTAYPGFNIQQGFNAKPSTMANGSYNTLIGIKNMVKPIYESMEEDAEGNYLPVGTVPSDGMFYGYSNPTGGATSADTTFFKPVTTNGNGPDTGIADLRFPMFCMNTQVYARFTNRQGESEVMLIKFFPASIRRTTNYADMSNMDNVGAIGLGFEPSPVQFDASLQQACAVGWVILQRNVENTTQRAFVGTTSDDDEHTFNVTHYNPSLVSQGWNSHSKRNEVSYFEILNGYANCEHQFELNSTGRDLLPIGPTDFTDNEWYNTSFAETNVIGEKSGGDFYLCKYANMPVVEDDGILRMVDNTLRLSELSVRVGQPTRMTGSDVSHTGKYQFVTHYDYMDISLEGDKVYFSPTDIANLITKQLHKPQDLYKSYIPSINGGGGRFDGGFWKNTAGKYPLNSLFRLIHGPSLPQSADGGGNYQNSKSGMLNSIYHEGDFCFELDMAGEVIKNGINAYGWCSGMLQGYADGGNQIATTLPNIDIMPPLSGKHKVWIANTSSMMNVYPTTDSYNLKGYGGLEQPNGGFVRTLMDASDYRTGKFDDNINYLQEATFGPMFCGSNNAQLNYNTDVSRFEWKFLHQSLYSEFTSDGSGNTSGGNVVAKIWGQSIQGYDNWDRYGGVNMLNWCANAVVRGTYSVRREATGTDPLTIADPIGLAFMNKLGFSTKWMAENSGSTDYEDCEDYSYSTAYKPKGTTRSDYDVAEARPYTQVNTLLNETRSAEGGFRTAYGTSPPTISPTDDDKLEYLQNDTTLISLGGKEVNLTNRFTYGGADPFGVENTPTTGTAKVTIKELGATLGYGMVNTLASPQSVIYKKTGVTTGTPDYGVKVPTDLNLDDVKFPNYEIEVDSSSLLADELPKKTLIGYFLIMSDLIDRHEFIGSANGGQPLNCIGILSKNYENNDFYYSFQSPVEFHIKQDRTISSIRTVITQPDLKDPQGLDYNSSIIYTIVRQQSLPEPDVPPIGVQQQLDYETMEQMSGMLGVDMKTFNPTSALGQMGLGQNAGVKLNSLRQSLVSAVLSPTRNSASMIASTESMMNTVISRMPFHERARAILQAGMGVGSQALKPSPLQAQMEGLGIAQPNSLTPQPYQSQAQLQIEAYNKVGGKKPAQSLSADDADFGYQGSVNVGPADETGVKPPDSMDSGVSTAPPSYTTPSVDDGVGKEALHRRISRSNHKDPQTRPDEKDMRATDFSKQNPYDLRTWTKGNLSKYQEDHHHGVPLEARTPDNRLSKAGLTHLKNEENRRVKGNMRKIQVKEGTGDYRNKQHEPKGYNPQEPHRTPHHSIGVIKRRPSATKRPPQTAKGVTPSQGQSSSATKPAPPQSQAQAPPPPPSQGN